MTTASADAVGDRQRVDVAVADLGIGETRLVELAPRVGEHRLIDVEAEPAFEAAGKELEHAAGARPKIDEHRGNGPGPSAALMASSTSSSAM